MITILIIDKDKNTIMIDLLEEEYHKLFENKIDVNKIKKHKTLPELDKEVRKYLKLDIFKKEVMNND